MGENKEWDFRMCKYCGDRITEGVNQWGKKNRKGLYCSASCASAVHGFDAQLKEERRKGKVRFDLKLHDRICESTLAPDEAAMDAEDGGLKPIRRMDPPTEAEIFDAAEEIDPRLPGILVGLKKGKTQEEMAKKLGVDQATVARCIIKLKAKLSGATTKKD